MAGGRGERFWPQSRARRPKQMLPIVGSEPLLRQTISRLAGFIPPEQVFIITSASLREEVIRLCPEIPVDQIIGEPVGRDTAPAVGLANVLVEKKCPGASWVMLPSDHIIAPSEKFIGDLVQAFQSVADPEHPAIATIGVQPTYPATGYGYIHRGKPMPERAGVLRVQRFVEKPNALRAADFLKTGEYYWNAGIFVWPCAHLRREIAMHAPELGLGLEKMSRSWAETGDFQRALADVYPTLPKISVDFALLEKTSPVLVIPSSFTWDDVGEWTALARHLPADLSENVIRGQALCLDSKNNLIVSDSNVIVALLGVHDLVVVQTADAILVCHRDRCQDIKQIVGELAKQPEKRTYI